MAKFSLIHGETSQIFIQRKKKNQISRRKIIKRKKHYGIAGFHPKTYPFTKNFPNKMANFPPQKYPFPKFLALQAQKGQFCTRKCQNKSQKTSSKICRVFIPKKLVKIVMLYITHLNFSHAEGKNKQTFCSHFFCQEILKKIKSGHFCDNL